MLRYPPIRIALLFAIILWSQGGIIAQAIAQALPRHFDERSVMNGRFDPTSCRAEGAPCLEALMRRSGVPAEAIAFARSLKFEGYLSEFFPVGRVNRGTISYPFRVNTNDEPVLLNGTPPFVDVWSEVGKLNLDADPRTAAVLAKNRGASMSARPPEFTGEQPLSGGGQRFLYRFAISTCRGCEALARPVVALDFDGGGRYVGVHIVQVSTGQ
jgi:hypothetical protein